MVVYWVRDCRETKKIYPIVPFFFLHLIKNGFHCIVLQWCSETQVAFRFSVAFVYLTHLDSSSTPFVSFLWSEFMYSFFFPVYFSFDELVVFLCLCSKLQHMTLLCSDNCARAWGNDCLVLWLNPHAHYRTWRRWGGIDFQVAARCCAANWSEAARQTVTKSTVTKAIWQRAAAAWEKVAKFTQKWPHTIYYTKKLLYVFRKNAFSSSQSSSRRKMVGFVS